MSILFFVISGLLFFLALIWMNEVGKGRGDLEVVVQTFIASGVFAIAGTLA